ncbi:SigE family RNA polymerase sigma factor [Flexivirga oryzae]|uniref:RNA polymerase sigma-70 factor (Sigma-E family) n=1 Tax=Flexivirga oryzae TaxID=1794944 RepID=A0A839N0C6_9MICO|nr:SigE family RNA polymerase sigma factor [Flexivirga oryzae]MBB2891158.1 RNA polymerase sigma-70 factor (sigma-E family) [Flexivirga oryzae]
MRRRDDTAFVRFVDDRSTQLLRMAYLLSGDQHLAEELVQETLERVYVRWGRLRQGQEMAYARRVLTNLRTDRWRRVRREVVTDELPESAAASRDSTADRDLLLRALGTLADREREIVVLRYYCDQSENSVAECLGISTGTVKSTASRALAKLRTQLDRPEVTR